MIIMRMASQSLCHTGKGTYTFSLAASSSHTHSPLGRREKGRETIIPDGQMNYVKEYSAHFGQ